MVDIIRNKNKLLHKASCDFGRPFLIDKSVIEGNIIVMFSIFCAVGRGRAGYRPDHDQQHCYHHVPTVKPEASTAVELLMMGVRMSETC